MQTCRLWWWCNTEEHPQDGTDTTARRRPTNIVTRPGGFSRTITTNIQRGNKQAARIRNSNNMQRQNHGKPEANHQMCSNMMTQIQEQQTRHQAHHAAKRTTSAEDGKSYSNFQRRSRERTAESTATNLWPLGSVVRLVGLAVLVCLFCSLSWV